MISSDIDVGVATGGTGKTRVENESDLQPCNGINNFLERWGVGGGEVAWSKLSYLCMLTK